VPSCGTQWALNLLPYSGLFSRGVYFTDFAERAQFATFKPRILIESGCGLVAALLHCFAEALAASKSRRASI
jgi:hypothetical protein